MYYIVDNREPGIRIGGYFFTREAAEKRLSRKNVERTRSEAAKEQIEHLEVRCQKKS